MNSVRVYFDLVRWDWVREMKRKDTILSMVLFSLVTLITFSFALPPQSESGVKARAGVLWVAYLLAGSIGIDRAFRAEGRVLEGVLLSPVGRTTLYFARLTSTYLFVIVMEAITFVSFCILYNVDLTWVGAVRIGIATLTATLGFVAAGVTLSAMTRAVRGGDILLRLLMFPLVIPLFYAVVSWTQLVFNGRSASAREVLIVVSFDLVYVAAGQLLFEIVVADLDP